MMQGRGSEFMMRYVCGPGRNAEVVKFTVWYMGQLPAAQVWLEGPEGDPLNVLWPGSSIPSTKVTMLCTRSSRAEIIIDSGRNPLGISRSLSGGTQHVSYQLYRDAGRTQVWGGAGNALQFVSNGVARPQQFVVYGRIPPGQEVASGVYTDVVTATVEF